MSRTGWYNLKVRKSHGPDARWSDGDEIHDGLVEEIAQDERELEEKFDAFLANADAEKLDPDLSADESSNWVSA